jgi:hypothetical protein
MTIRQLNHHYNAASTCRDLVGRDLLSRDLLSRDLLSTIIEDLTLTALNNASVNALATLADHRGPIVTVCVLGSDPELVTAATALIDASIAEISLEAPLLRRAIDNDELADLLIYVIDQPRARDLVTLGQRPPAPHRPVDPLRTLIIRSATAATLRQGRVIDPIVAPYARDDIDVSLRACAATFTGSFTDEVLAALRTLSHQMARSATDYVAHAACEFPDIAWRSLVEQVGVHELQALGLVLGNSAAPPSLNEVRQIAGHQGVTQQLQLIAFDGASIVDLTVASHLSVMLANHRNDWPASVVKHATRALVSWRQAHVGLSHLDVLHDLRREPNLSDDDRAVLTAGVSAVIGCVHDTPLREPVLHLDALTVAQRLAFHPLTPRSLSALARRTIDTLDT